MKLTSHLVMSAAALSVGAMLLAQTALSAENAPTMQGKAAANEAEFLNKPVKFSMKTLDDKVISQDDFKGKVVLIDFWATWCIPCRGAAPKLQKMHNELSSKGLVVIGANLGEHDEKRGLKDNAVEYVAAHEYTYTFTYGNDDWGKEQRLIGYPTFYLIGRDGNLKQILVGYDDKKLREAVEAEVAK